MSDVSYYRGLLEEAREEAAFISVWQKPKNRKSISALLRYHMLMTILVGCSGRFYDDWVCAFYPMEMANKNGEWFDSYSQYFSTVEINSTIYRPPGDFQVNAWIKKAKGKKGFEYSVKCPSVSLTKPWWREARGKDTHGTTLRVGS